MPIRRSAAAPPKEDTTSALAPESDAKDKSDDSKKASTPDVEANGEGEKSTESTAEGEKAAEDGEAADGDKLETKEGEDQGKKKKKKDKKDEKDVSSEEKTKKVKRKIPSWATMSASRLAYTPKNVSLSQPKVEEILIDAIQNCKERTGTSIYTIMKFILNKYTSMEMDKRTKSMYKRGLKRLVEKGVVKQLKGKGFSGSFTIGKLPAETNSKKKPSAISGNKGTLSDALPLMITRLCEPKEASYILIKKYLEQHFPQLNVENRPDVLKNCLQRSVEKGYLEQITGKGASGTFQLKKSGNKVLLGGGILEDAIVAAITAMNEPKCVSISTLRKFLVEGHKDKNAYVVANLKRTLKRCKMMGWMEQITGHGLSGTYQLCYPFYPSPSVLIPDVMEKIKQKEKRKEQRRKSQEESEDEDDEEEEEEEEEENEEDEEEEESEDEEPVSHKRNQKRSAPRGRQPPPKRAKTTSRKPPAKRAAPPAKRSAPPAKKGVSKAAPPKKVPPPAKATPVKKAAPAHKPKTPIAKKLTSRVSKRPAAKKTPVKKETATESKSAGRKSLRGKK